MDIICAVSHGRSASLAAHAHHMATFQLLRPPFVSRETLPSYVSRLAARNGLPVRAFMLDLGIWKRISFQIDDDLRHHLISVLPLEEREVDELISWSGNPDGDNRCLFRGETIISRSLRNPVQRGCPKCLQEDVASGGDGLGWSMALRGDWQFREVSVCLRHSHPLVDLWNEPKMAQRQFASLWLQNIQAEVMAVDFDQPSCKVSDFDRWLDRRLETGNDETWLAGHSLFAATVFCRLLGKELQRLAGESIENDALRDAQARGFKVASQGEAAILDAFDRLARQGSTAQHGHQAAFGNLYLKLSKE